MKIITWTAVFLLINLLIGCNGEPHATYPTDLAKHWICSKAPEGRGLFLRPDGTGTLEGTNRALGGRHIAWKVELGRLKVREFGEEGEHGPYYDVPYELKQDRLTVRVNTLGCNNFELSQIKK